MSAPGATTPTYRHAIAARDRAAHALFEAELAAHDAHQTHVDSWIRAANDRLHVAVTGYEQALAALRKLEPIAA